MGLISKIGDVITRGKKADSGLSATDNTAVGGSDEAAKASSRPGAGGGDEVAQGFDYGDDRFAKRLSADVAQRLSEQPSRAVNTASANLARTAKYGGAAGVAGTGLYVGNEAFQAHQSKQIQESKEASYEEYVSAAEEVRNNDNLTPEEKEAQLAELRKAYEKAVKDASRNEPDNWFQRQYQNVFGGAGMIEKVIIAIVVIAIIRAVSKRWDDGGA